MSEGHSSHKGICRLSFQFTEECGRKPFEKQGSTDSKGSGLTLCFSGKHNRSCSRGCGCRRAETYDGLHSMFANNKQKQQNTPKTANRNEHSTTKPKTCPFCTLKTSICQLVALPMTIKGQLLSLFGHLEKNADSSSYPKSPSLARERDKRSSIERAQYSRGIHQRGIHQGGTITTDRGRGRRQRNSLSNKDPGHRPFSVVYTKNMVYSYTEFTSASGLVVKSNVAIVGPPVRFRACAFSFWHMYTQRSSRTEKLARAWCLAGGHTLFLSIAATNGMDNVISRNSNLHGLAKTPYLSTPSLQETSCLLVESTTLFICLDSPQTRNTPC